MLISLAVAFIFTPWLTRKALGHMAGQGHAQTDAGSSNPLMRRLFQRVMPPFLSGGRGRAMRWLLLLSVLILIAGSLAWW